jgi:hypothetical protein
MNAVLALFLLGVFAPGASGEPALSQSDDDEPALKAAWVADSKTGCKVWNPHPQRGETISWNGVCKNGLAEGRGHVQWFRDGMPYERSDGQWREGKQTGQGVQVWPGGRYEGGMRDSEPEGRGILILNDVRYQGEFHDGLPEGEGVLKSSDGVFQGAWKRGCFNDGARRAALGVPVASCRLSAPLPDHHFP